MICEMCNAKESVFQCQVVSPDDEPPAFLPLCQKCRDEIRRDGCHVEVYQ